MEWRGKTRRGLATGAAFAAGCALAALWGVAGKPPPSVWPPGAEPGAAVPGGTGMADHWLIVDVRTPEEYAAGHLEGALLLPHGTAAENLERLVPDFGAPVALYCRSGRRSGLVADELARLGYTRAVNWGGFAELAKTRAAVWPAAGPAAPPAGAPPAPP